MILPRPKARAGSVIISPVLPRVLPLVKDYILEGVWYNCSIQGGRAAHRTRPMQGSTRCKRHERPGKPARNDKGRAKPQAKRQAKARRQALKKALGV